MLNKEKGAAWQGDPDCKSIIIHNRNNTETAPNLQALRSVSKFGFAFETAVTISQLAWGICR